MKDDQHLDDEGDAEEESDAAHPGVAAAPFEGLVVEAIGDDTEQEEQRRDQDAGQQWIDVVAVIAQIHAIGRQHQESRMRDMGHVQ